MTKRRVTFLVGILALLALPALAQTTPGGITVPQATGMPPIRGDWNGSSLLPPQYSAGSVQMPNLPAMPNPGSSNNMPPLKSSVTLPTGMVPMRNALPPVNNAVPPLRGAPSLATGSVPMASGTVPMPSGTVPMASGMPPVR